MPRGTLITPDGTRIAYRTDLPPRGPAGPTTSPPVLLLDGPAGRATDFDDLTARLCEDGHRVVRVVRYEAQGDAGRAAADTGRTATTADAAALLRHLGLVPAVLIARSEGGRTARELACAAPHLVLSLILLDGPSDAGRKGDVRDTRPTLALRADHATPHDPHTLHEVISTFLQRTGATRKDAAHA
ncbi:alpha/beta hydrolase [Streptomyces longwoodensis]|uniref:alpha/beta fold hydrolase n=1 Tax=Streptomyces longwoodensis TaxID=68231 RepID=UPI0033FE6561